MEIHRRFEGTLLVSADTKDGFIQTLRRIADRLLYETESPLNHAEHLTEYNYSYCVTEDSSMTAQQYQKDLAEIIPE